MRCICYRKHLHPKRSNQAVGHGILAHKLKHMNSKNVGLKLHSLAIQRKLKMYNLLGWTKVDTVYAGFHCLYWFFLEKNTTPVEKKRGSSQPKTGS